MKRLLFLFFLSLAATGARAQSGGARTIAFTTSVGTGFSVNTPAVVPVTWQVLAHYRPTPRWSVGAGTGLSFYEKMLVPLYGDAKYQIGRERKLTPFLEMAAGYAFSTSRNANGGWLMNPSFGVQIPLKNRLKLQLAVGYEWQKLERLKTQTDRYFRKEFVEKLSHSMISIRVGLSF